MDDPLIDVIVDINNEIKLCQEQLGSNLDTSQKIRQELREKGISRLVQTEVARNRSAQICCIS